MTKNKIDWAITPKSQQLHPHQPKIRMTKPVRPTDAGHLDERLENSFGWTGSRFFSVGLGTIGRSEVVVTRFA